MSTLTHPSPRAVHQPAATTGGLFTWSQVRQALPGAFRKLDPRQMWRNPVMFLVWVGAALTTVIAVAEGRGKAQADSLRRTRTATVAHRVAAYDETGDPGALRARAVEVSSADL